MYKNISMYIIGVCVNETATQISQKTRKENMLHTAFNILLIMNVQVQLTLLILLQNINNYSKQVIGIYKSYLSKLLCQPSYFLIDFSVIYV